MGGGRPDDLASVASHRSGLSATGTRACRPRSAPNPQSQLRAADAAQSSHRMSGAGQNMTAEEGAKAFQRAATTHIEAHKAQMAFEEAATAHLQPKTPAPAPVAPASAAAPAQHSGPAAGQNFSHAQG